MIRFTAPVIGLSFVVEWGNDLCTCRQFFHKEIVLLRDGFDTFSIIDLCQ